MTARWVKKGTCQNWNFI